MPLKPSVHLESDDDENKESGGGQSFVEIRDLRDLIPVDRTKRSYQETVSYIAGYITKKVCLFYLLPVNFVVLSRCQSFVQYYEKPSFSDIF